MTGLLHEKHFSRKTFVKGGGALVVGFSMAAAAGRASAAAGNYATEGTWGGGATGNTPFNERTGADYLPNLNTVDAWIAITPENKVILTTGETELGHGTPTGLLMLVAEELNMGPNPTFGLTTDEKAQVQWAHPETWLNATGGGGGSGGISSRSLQARAAAAYAMQILYGMASLKLGVPVANLSAANGTIKGNGQSVTYAQLIGGQNFNYDMGTGALGAVAVANGGTATSVTENGNPPANLVVSAIPGVAPAKAVSQYSIVGTAVQRIDVPQKVTGQYTYIQNVRLPGMVHARSVRPRGAGANTFENDTPLSIDATSIAHIPGAQVVQLKNFVAVVAPLEYNAIQAAAQLKVNWLTQQGFPQPSANYWSWLRQAGDTNTLNPARYIVDTGGVPAALASAAHTVSATYKYHYNNFVPIGPHAAVADVKGNQSALIFGMGESISNGTPSSGLSYVLGIPPNQIRFVWYEGASMFGGGQFAEAAEQAAVVSQAVGKPVRMQWMRWDQTGWDSYGPSQMYDVTMGANANGQIVAADWTAYGQPGGSIDETQRLLGLTTWAAVPGNGGPTPSDTGVYGVPGTYGPSYVYQRRVLAKTQPQYGGSLKTSALRAPNAPQSYFASEQIVDELAHAAGMDPVAFRKVNIDGTSILGARWLATLDAVTQAAGWTPRVAGSIKQSGTIRKGRRHRRGERGDRQDGRQARLHRAEQRDHHEPVARHQPDERRPHPGSLPRDVGAADLEHPADHEPRLGLVSDPALHRSPLADADQRAPGPVHDGRPGRHEGGRHAGQHERVQRGLADERVGRAPDHGDLVRHGERLLRRHGRPHPAGADAAERAAAGAQGRGRRLARPSG
jgi:CO/xanthine dehydrogenase Mo-binding subunit